MGMPYRIMGKPLAVEEIRRRELNQKPVLLLLTKTTNVYDREKRGIY